MACFKCGSAGGLPFHKSAPYLAAKLYLCPSCIRPRKKHSPNVEFDCGCTEKREVGNLEKHWIPPNPLCAACSGTGKIKDRHHYLQIKKSVGACDPERGRHGHSYQSEEDPYLADDGWSVKGRRYLRWEQELEGMNVLSEKRPRRPRGRPKKTTPNLDVTKLYMVSVANEVAKEFEKILDLEGADFMLALDVVTNILLARGK